MKKVIIPANKELEFLKFTLTRLCDKTGKDAQEIIDYGRRRDTADVRMVFFTSAVTSDFRHRRSPFFRNEITVPC